MSHLSRMNREAWAAELGRPGSARAAGLSPVSGDTIVLFPGFGEGRKRQRWCPQGEPEPPAAPEEHGPVKTGRSCWSGSLTLDLALPDNDSPELTSPGPSITAPDTSHHSLLLPDQEQAPWSSPAVPTPVWGHRIKGIPGTPSAVPAHPRP